MINIMKLLTVEKYKDHRIELSMDYDTRRIYCEVKNSDNDKVGLLESYGGSSRLDSMELAKEMIDIKLQSISE